MFIFVSRFLDFYATADGAARKNFMRFYLMEWRGASVNSLPFGIIKRDFRVYRDWAERVLTCWAADSKKWLSSECINKIWNGLRDHLGSWLAEKFLIMILIYPRLYKWDVVYLTEWLLPLVLHFVLQTLFLDGKLIEKLSVHLLILPQEILSEVSFFYVILLNWSNKPLQALIFLTELNQLELTRCNSINFHVFLQRFLYFALIYVFFELQTSESELFQFFPEFRNDTLAADA